VLEAGRHLAEDLEALVRELDAGSARRRLEAVEAAVHGEARHLVHESFLFAQDLHLGI
jgi:hypothetical protein